MTLMRRKEVANWAAVSGLIVGITLGAISLWDLRAARQREKKQVLITVSDLLHDAWDKLEGKRGAELGTLSLANDEVERSSVIEAGRAIDQVLRLDPTNITALGYRGIYLTKLGQYDAAEDVFRRAIVLDPRNAWLYEIRGGSRRVAGKRNLAMTDLKTSIELNPTTAVYERLSLGYLLESQGKLDEAIALYRKASEISPISALAHMRIAGVLQKRGEFDNAISEYRKAATGQPPSSESYTALAFAEALTGNAELGGVYIETALQLAPRDTQVLEDVGGASTLRLADRRKQVCI
ncbi:MAG: tetratricopeptide repeat protein [Acidobacteria bacterium]|nr:tetratricopeptide repeat protein [Acidobacteriota bacterium]